MKEGKKLNNKHAANDVVSYPIIQFWSLISSPNSNIAINVAIKQQIAHTHTNALARNKYKCVMCLMALCIFDSFLRDFHILLAFSVDLGLKRVGEGKVVGCW